MADIFYPQLEVQTLRNIKVILQLLKQHPSYFLESPYPGEVEKFFNDLTRSSHNTPPEESAEFKQALGVVDFEGPNKWENLAKEARVLYVGMRGLKSNDGTPNEKLNFYKTSQVMLEKLVSLEERALGLKQVHQFQKEVMGVMEECLTPSQRTDVMERLQAILDTGSTE